MTNNPLYTGWANMVARCTNPNAPRYERYGGRGISIHTAWLDYPTFVRDIEATIGPRPANPQGWTSSSTYWTLDRINNDGDYEPGNVRWATPTQQTNNRRAATDCSNGHAYTEANTYTSPLGKRQCRTCWRLWHEKQKAAAS